MAIEFSPDTGEQPFPLARGYGLPARQRTAMQQLFLDRLNRLVRKVHLHGRYLAPTDRRMQLLNRAILSTFCDCRDLGVETEARAILAGLRRDIVLAIAPAAERPAF